MLDQEFFKVTIDLEDGDPVDLGLGFRSVEQAQQRLTGMNAWLQQRRDGLLKEAIAKAVAEGQME